MKEEDFEDLFQDEDFNEDFDPEELEKKFEALMKNRSYMKPDGEENPFFMVHHKDIFLPAQLKKGDKIAILSPASAVKEEYVLGAMERIMERGYQPVLMKYAIGHESGSFSATKGDRLMDMFEALQDSQYKAIFCTRGGYGCGQLLVNFSYGLIANNPKWLIGFSDVSALLAMWYRSNIASIHGPMAKHLATMPANDPCTDALFKMLENGGKFDYTVAAHEYNRPGKVSGILRGGNLAVLNDLSDTPCDILSTRGETHDVILFLEDINEPIYKVNRMLWRLINSGFLTSVKGIIFGQFTDYKPDANYGSMEDMIHEFIDRTMIPENIPVAYNFPTGHTDVNYPLTVGARVELEVTDSKVRIHTI